MKREKLLGKKDIKLTKKQYKEKYNAEERTADPDKIRVNQIIGELARTRKDKEMIILDCEKLQTLHTLVKSGVSANNIHIPNPYVFKKIIKKHENTYNMLLGEYIDNLSEIRSSKESIGLSFFDYMSCLDGNQEVHPIEDIKNYFDYKLPANNSILAITLSFRGGPKKMGGTYNETCRTDMLVGYSAYENGYYAIKLDLGFAYNGMYVHFYKILKQDRLIK